MSKIFVSKVKDGMKKKNIHLAQEHVNNVDVSWAFSSQVAGDCDMAWRYGVWYLGLSPSPLVLVVEVEVIVVALVVLLTLSDRGRRKKKSVKSFLAHP